MSMTSTISTEKFFLNAFEKTFLNSERRDILLNIANKIIEEYNNNKLVNINFICTHNSRRSQMAQVWAFFAAQYFNLNINSFSGGTEITSFNRNTIKTLQKASIKFQLDDFSHQNPKYLISFKGISKTLLVFSKRYDYKENKTPFIAITTCDNANAKCLFIPEASRRFHLPFEDPQSSENTELRDKKYLEINEKIAAEIYFIFLEINKKRH
ncbi:hypothetical protein [Polaribacter sargassicola]|uniref:hypothetical protein n=1 Tax=Polaribacter sargassicola TaxID=2836891 RepID=UPI001F282965|nr:hypothetical protein [Polaribacter sp. DS7-9]MCG1037755.1 hypothetical protein [Polaribacter sp. DS7-9]